MRLGFSTTAACIVAAIGCDQPQPAPIEVLASDQSPIVWPDDWSNLLGQTVTVDGWAAECTIGPAIYGDTTFDKRQICIDGPHWPDSYYKSSSNSKRVRVTGTVIKRDDMPVYLANRETGLEVGDTSGLRFAPAGIPVYSTEELNRQKWRFLLKDVTWKVLD